MLEKLPFSDRPDVRQRIDELFSRQMLGAVLVGKFVGDYAAILAVTSLGTHLGYLTGVITTVSVFIYWDRIHQRAQQEAEKIRPSQTTLDNYQGGEE